MKSPRFRPFDLPGTPPSEPATVVEAPDAPEDLNYPPLGLDSPEGAGALTRGQERAVRPDTVELPPLNLNPRPGAVSGGEPRAAPIYVAAAAVSCLWALTPIMFALGYRRGVAPFESDLFAFTVFVLMGLGPVALVWIAAFMLHQGLRLAAQAKRAHALADNLIQPTALAARGVGSAVESVRQEIEQATAAAAHARAELFSMRDLLAEESERLIAATAGSRRNAADLTLELAGEREKMHQLADQLGSQAIGVVDAISQHARMVAEASDLAETQIREAEAALAARAADLAAAAGGASDAARTAGEDLSRQVGRLETASLGVGDQVRALEEGLTEQRAALVTTAHGMRADHEAFSTEAESQRAQLAELLVHARGGASELGETASRTAEALRQLIASATDQLRAMAAGAAEEREMFKGESIHSLAAVAEIAKRQSETIEGQTRQAVDALSAAAEQARRAAEDHGHAMREKLDQLNQAAFDAGQQADAVFEARLNQARALIEQSARMVENAGALSTARLGEGADAARSTLAQLERLLGDIDARVAGLPGAAQAQVDAVRQSVERNIGELMGSARRAAEETQAIDAAFQDRVRRNYEMLGEAVRLMGVVAGASGGGARSAVRPAEPSPTLAPAVSESRPRAPRHDEPPAAAADSLRPRLRLTPTASDEEFKTAFDAAGGRETPEPAAPAQGAAGAPDGWTWKDLLSSMDKGAGDGLGDHGPDDDQSLADTLLTEIGTMGIDARALLPRMRIDQIAAAIRAGEPRAGRELVRQLAPAAVRRLARRMLSDSSVRGQADRYVRRYQAMIAETAADDKSFVTSALLGSDQGRAYLLFDAAFSDEG
jgi:hypothetical protein